MTIEIVQSSRLVSEAPPPNARNGKYPFSLLAVGQSFTLQIVGTNAQSLRACVANRNKKANKKFVLVRHVDLGILEVGRVL